MKNFFNIGEVIFKTRKARAIYLFGVPFVLSFLIFFVFFSGTFFVDYSVYTTASNGSPSVESQDSFQNALDQFSYILKLPTFLINFDVYAYNAVSAETLLDEKVGMLLNVDVGGHYTGSIKTGQIKKVFDSLNLSKINSTTFSRSFKPDDSVSSNTRILKPSPEPGSHFRIFLLPTLWSFLLVYLSLIVVFYGIVILIDAILNFIYFGVPIHHTLQKLKQ